jgi:hypothetical protein
MSAQVLEQAAAAEATESQYLSRSSETPTDGPGTPPVEVKEQAAPGRATQSRRPAGKKAAPKAPAKKTETKPAAKKAAAVDPLQKKYPSSVAKTNYRSIETTDELVAAVRKELGDKVKGLSNDHLVGAMGWALVPKGAIKKVLESL